MLKPKFVALAAAAACILPSMAHAQDSALDAIRSEIQQMKQTYEKQIKALEQRLKEAETAAAKAQQAASQAQQAASQASQTATQAQGAAAQAETKGKDAEAAATSVQTSSNQSSQNSFNPGLSLILQGGYYDLSQDPSTRGITGFVPTGEFELPERGFNLGETELTISANIDHLFYGQATLAIEEGAIGVEEAFFQTLALGHGLTLKGGRFFSGIGYFNSIHRHAWDFSEAALVQQSFLGPNLGMDGLQLAWIAPISSVYLDVGGEIGKPVEFPFEDSDKNKNGIAGSTLFAHLGGDIGLSHSYRLGAWWLQAGNRTTDQSILDLDERTGVADGLSGGNTQLYGLDFVYKWAPNGDPSRQNFKLVAEWMQRKLDGTLTYDIGGTGLADSFAAKQSGWYVQGVYQFHPHWRVGARYGQLQSGSYDLGPALIGAPGLMPADYNPKRISTMIDWSPSEFSRFRFQYNQDKAQQGVTDNQFFLEYILSLGVHGAHRF